MEYRFLKSEVRENGIVVLTLANPASLNALNSATLQEINHFVMNLPESASLLIITGEGKAFVAGADISEQDLRARI
jgi:enoyl-CoA hydratase